MPPAATSRILSYDGCFDLVAYDGMEHDPERRAALEQPNSDPGS